MGWESKCSLGNHKKSTNSQLSCNQKSQSCQGSINWKVRENVCALSWRQIKECKKKNSQSSQQNVVGES